MATTRARLDDKVGRMRTQKMSFTNDGLAVSLDVPDSSDVRETFSSMVDTVVEQETEISGLNTTLDRVNQEHKRNEKKLLIWTANAIDDLKRKNAILSSQLNDVNNKIKNLSYNIQGFVDDEGNDLIIEDPASVIVPTISGVIGNVDEDAHDGIPVLFSTEEGGNAIGPSIGIAELALDSNPKQEIRKFAKYKTDEERTQAKEMYKSARFNALPMDVKKKWRWAINKVITMVRIRDAKIGLTRTRLDNTQTLGGQLERVQQDLYNLPIALREELHSKTDDISSRLDSATSQLDIRQNVTAERLDRVSDKLDESVSDITGEVNSLKQNLELLVGQLQQATSGESQKLRDAIIALETQVRDSNDWEIDRLRKSMDAVVSELNEMEASGDRLLQNLEAIGTQSVACISSSEDSDEMSELVDLLQLDTRMREARMAFTRELVDLAACNRQYENIFHDAKILLDNFNRKMAISPRGKGNVPIITSTQIQELEALIGRCTGIKGHLQHIRNMNAAMERICKEHDHRIEQKYSTLLNVRSTAGVDESRSKMRRRMKSQSHSMDEHDREAARIDEAINPKTQAILGEFAMRLSLVESMIPELNEQEETEGKSQTEVNDEKEAREVKENLMLKREPPVLDDSDTEMESTAVVRHASEEKPPADQKHEIASRATAVAVTPVSDAATSPIIQQEKKLPTSSAETIVNGNANILPLPSNSGPAQVETEDRDKLGTMPKLSSAKWGKRHRNSLATQVVLEAKLRPMIERIIEKNFQMRFEDGSDDESDAAPAVNRQVSFAQSASEASSPTSSVDEGGPKVEAEPITAPMTKIKSSRILRVNSTKSQSSRYSDRGKPLFDPSYLIEDITELKKQNRDLVAEIQRLKEDRCTMRQVEDAFVVMMKAYKKDESQSHQMLAIQNIEKTVHDVVKELRVVKKDQANEIESMQELFHKALVNAVVSAVQEASDQNSESVLNTRAMCLGCGRDSIVGSVQRTRPTSPAFLPQLSANSLPGPDVYRAGFKIPVKPLSSHYVLEPTNSDNVHGENEGGGGKVDLRNAKDRININAVSAAAAAATQAVLKSSVSISAIVSNLDPSDAPMPISDMPSESALRIGFRDDPLDRISDADNSPGQIDKVTMNGVQLSYDPPTDPIVNRPKTAGARTVRHAHGNLEGEKARPMYRKGLAGKKSKRAETAYAPQRFDLPGSRSTQLRLDSLHADPSLSIASSTLPHAR